MKKLLKVLTMFCLIAIVGVTLKPVTVNAASYITSEPKVNYSYQSQSDSFTFYADSSWTAEYQGYPGVVTITSSKSGNSGTNTLRFNVNENKTSIDVSGAIIIKGSNGGVLCATNIMQAKNGNASPANPANNSSNNNNGQSGNSQSTPQKNYNVYITKGEEQAFSYEAQKGSIDFYADRDWTAEYQGYPGMISITSGKSGCSGSHTVYFSVAANSQNYDREGVILIRDAKYPYTVLCHANLWQEGKNKQTKSNYFKNLSTLVEDGYTYLSWEDQYIDLGFESNCDIKVTVNGSAQTMNAAKQPNGSTKYTLRKFIAGNYGSSTRYYTIKVSVSGNKIVGGSEHTYYVSQKASVLKDAKITNGFASTPTYNVPLTVEMTTNGNVNVWYEFGRANDRKTTSKKYYGFIFTSSEKKYGKKVELKPFSICDECHKKVDYYSVNPILCIQLANNPSKVVKINIKWNTPYGKTKDPRTETNNGGGSINGGNNGGGNGGNGGGNTGGQSTTTDKVDLESSFTLDYGSKSKYTSSRYEYWHYKNTSNHTLNVGTTVADANLNFYFSAKQDWVLLEEYLWSDGYVDFKKMHPIVIYTKNSGRTPDTNFANKAKMSKTEQKYATFTRTYYLVPKSVYDKYLNYNWDDSTFNTSQNIFAKLQEGEGKDYVKLFSLTFNSK